MAMSTSQSSSGLRRRLRNGIEDPSSVANLPQPIEHPPPRDKRRQAVRSCPWMPWHRPCPRSGLTVPLPRVVMVFYSGNKPIWNACCKRHHRHSPSPSGPVEPAAGLFDDLHRSDNGTPNIRVLRWLHGWSISRFCVEVKGPEEAEQPCREKEDGSWNGIALPYAPAFNRFPTRPI